jgi:hypothetical protein
MDNRRVKINSISLIIRKMQIRDTFDITSHLSEMAIIKKTKKSLLAGHGARELLVIVIKISAAIMESRMEISQKLKIQLLYDPAI